MARAWPCRRRAATWRRCGGCAMMVQREALTLAYNDVLLLMAAFFVLALPLVLLLRKPSPAAAAAGGH